MLKVLILKGLPASGKSSYCKELINKDPNKYKRINKDLLREMFDNSHWSKDSEKFILKIRDTLILESLSNEKHVLVDDTNLSPKHYEHIKQLVNKLADVEVIDFTNIPPGECIKRDLKRPNSVGSKVIMDMYNQFLKPKVPVNENNPYLPNCVIFDSDGTLNRIVDRSPYDGSDLSKDSPIQHTIDLLNSRKEKGDKVFIFSGLEDKYQQQRENWLRYYKVNYDVLKMRKTGDQRKDWEIKNEIFKEEIEGKYNVMLICDDRKQMNEHWINMGYADKLLCVGNPYLEF